MGALMRRIRLVQHRDEVRGALEDDFHHFRVALRHGHGHVTAIAGDALRHPYNLCPGALGVLQQLEGKPLAHDLEAMPGYSDRLQHCTHLYDLACLAITLAAEGVAARTYGLRVDDPEGNSPRIAQLRVDGRLVLDWRLLDGRVVSPGDFQQMDLRGGFRRHLDNAGLPRAAVIAASVLRRGIFISTGRFAHWGENLQAQKGGCYTLQPNRINSARLIAHSGRDFSRNAAALTRDDDAWLTATDAGFDQPWTEAKPAG